jgi:hypothetical protein
VLPQLTRYLLQFHQVYIPSVGTIRLVQQPAQLDVASKQIRPPYFTFQFSEDGRITKHQLWQFSSQLHFDETATRKALEDAGAHLKQHIQQQPFTWHEIGTFRIADHKMVFEPQEHAPILQPVVAERVLREHVQHSVLVGDQLVLSDGHAQILEAEQRHWNWSRILGWAAVILSVFFILFYLYQHQFEATATGLHQHVEADTPHNTYEQ